MPLSSFQIAQMNGAFQQQGMNNMQAAGMIGSPHGGPSTGENVMGRMANIGSSVASPMAMGGLALAGLDPLSLGARAAWGARGAGMLGAGAAGLGVAGAVAAPLMAAQYMGGQMMQGMQQQQQFNRQMGQSFSFTNPYAQGGKGFTTSQMGDIGASMRTMAGQQGPGGEMVGFEELGRMASNMGRMGMAQGVRDAKDFNEKFKVMVTSLKEIATNMGTSLEEAQKVMSSMRSSGVFGAGKAAQFSGMIKTGAAAGGLAASELTGMMNIGSQVSRMYGGRGSSGAQAGIEAITNIGTAQRAGLMSEEDIYNVTGLTGAEGRQAMATNMLQQSGKFLKSGLGRRVVAAMAGKGGELDEASVNRFMRGGVGTGETMQMAGKNLSKVGRADFIRNEGRLRGEVMERFGGLMPAIAMKGWLEQRGMDVNEDSDRAMIFLQRRLGMGNDEAEQMVKMAQHLPQLMQRRQEAGEEAGFAQKIKERRSHAGIEGVKKKLEKARADVQNTLQQAGADFYSEGSNMIESFVNKLTGDYVKTYRTDAARMFKEATSAGPMGESTWKQQFGGGRMFGDIGKGFYQKGQQDIFGKGGGGAGDIAEFGRRDAGRFAEAGYYMGGISTSKGLSSRLSQINEMGMAFQTGGQGLDEVTRASFASLGASGGDRLRLAIATGGISGKGEDRLSSYDSFINKVGSGGMTARFSNGSQEDRTRMVASMLGGAGIRGEGKMFAAPELQGLYGASQFGTEAEMNQAMGAGMLSQARSPLEAWQRARASAVGTVAGIAARGAMGIFGLMGVGGAVGEEVGKMTTNLAEGMGGGLTGRTERGAGAFMRSEGGRKTAMAALGGDAEGRKGARNKLIDRMMELQQGGEMDETQRGEFEASKSILAAQALAAARTKYGGEVPEEELKKISDELRLQGPGDLKQRAMSVGGILLEEQKTRIRSAAEQLGPIARKRVEQMRRAGTFSMNERGGLVLGQEHIKALGAIGKLDEHGISAGQRFISGMMQGEVLQSELQGRAGTEGMDRMLLGKSREAMMGGQEALAGMSVAEKRKLAEQAEMMGMGDAASEVGEQANIQARLEKGGGPASVSFMEKRFGRRTVSTKGVGALAGVLGTKLSAKDITAAYASGGGDRAITSMLMSRTGMEGEDVQRQVMTAVQATRHGDTGAASRLLKPLRAKAFEAEKGKREAAQRNEDPLSSKIEGHLQTISNALTGKDKKKMEVTVSNWPPGGVPAPEKIPPKSDERLKKNIEPMSNVLDKVSKLIGYEYDWKENGIHDVGLLAQEVAEVLPEAVTVDAEGVMCVHYYKVIPLAVEAIKELITRIERLEAKLT